MSESVDRRRFLQSATLPYQAGRTLFAVAALAAAMGNVYWAETSGMTVRKFVLR